MSVSDSENFKSHFPTLQEGGHPQPKISPAAKIYASRAGKVSSGHQRGPTVDLEEFSSSHSPVSMFNLLNYELLFEVGPPQPSGPHTLTVPRRPNALVTPPNVHQPTGHQPQVSTTKEDPIELVEPSPASGDYVVKRPRPLHNKSLLDARSDSHQSAFKTVTQVSNTKRVHDPANYPKFVKDSNDFGHRRKVTTLQLAVPPQPVSGGSPEPGGVPDTLPVKITTPFPSYLPSSTMEPPQLSSTGVNQGLSTGKAPSLEP